MALIEKEKLIAEYDRAHVGPAGGARKLMEEAPEVDAIPTDWIRTFIWQLKNMGEEIARRDAAALSVMLDKWYLEQARKEND